MPRGAARPAGECQSRLPALRHRRRHATTVDRRPLRVGASTSSRDGAAASEAPAPRSTGGAPLHGRWYSGDHADPAAAPSRQAAEQALAWILDALRERLGAEFAHEALGRLERLAPVDPQVGVGGLERSPGHAVMTRTLGDDDGRARAAIWSVRAFVSGWAVALGATGGPLALEVALVLEDLVDELLEMMRRPELGPS